MNSNYTTMQKYIFKKGGRDNNKIIVALIHFILRSFENKTRLVMVYKKGPAYFITNNMLAQSDLSYMLIDVHAGLSEMRANTILQFYLKHHTHPTADDAIWISDKAEVHIEESNGIVKSFTIIEKDILHGDPIEKKLMAK